MGDSSGKDVYLILEDGTEFKGKSFGADTTVYGEVGKYCLLCDIILFERGNLQFSRQELWGIPSH